MVKLLIITCALLAFVSSTLIIPESNSALVKGIFDGSGLGKFLNISSCQNEFDTFFSNLINSVNASPLSPLDTNLRASSRSINEIADLVSKCEGTKQAIDYLLQYSLNVYSSPQKFLEGVISNGSSLKVIWIAMGLKSLIKGGEFYQFGQSLGEILAITSKVDLSEKKSNLQFLDSPVSETCMSSLYGLKDDLFEVVSALSAGDLNDAEKHLEDFVDHAKKAIAICFG